ncbi:MAG TPA: BrnT family toxin [Bacteroidales bacterium]|nr:BrnT family toxin [Bacteroidales bacterium]
MKFEFDEQKSSTNKSKHGIDFIEAQQIWNDPERVEIPARTSEEPRIMIIGRIGQSIRAGIYTIRNKNIRLISVRKARKDEKEIYESI